MSERVVWGVVSGELVYEGGGGSEVLGGEGSGGGEGVDGEDAAVDVVMGGWTESGTLEELWK